ncbi:MAG: S8 family serine peptidase [Ignavibacteria bacterium]|nr:S8 family serine peptidase [Ignavibacteria bacterium]
MKSTIVFLLAAGALFCSGITRAESSRIHPYLQGVIESAPATQFVDVYAVLGDRVKASDLAIRTSGMKRKARQSEVVRILKDHSASTRGAVESFLRQAESSGMVRDITIIWAINTISFSATPAIIEEVSAKFPELERIHFDPKFPEEQLVDDNGISKRNAETGAQVSPIMAPQIGLTLINAPAVWAEGDSGAGVIVANIDTGCDWDHSDLVRNMWNNLGEDANGNNATIIWNGASWVFDPGDVNGIDDDGNGHVDDFLGWDYVGNDNNPSGGASHGTSTSGIVAGDGTGGTQTGVAPRAKLMILEPNGEASVWTAMQYAIDKGADITTSSLSYKWYFNPQPNYPMWREMTDLELAAGMVHTNSTSNDGGLFSIAPIPYNISAPGNSPPSWIHPDQTLVGGLSSVIGAGNVEASTDIIATSSPYGPSAWEDIQSVHPGYPFAMPAGYQDYPFETVPGAIGLLKPDVSAPGNGTTSTREGGGYSTFSGTSGATPHVAGTAALLLGANPNLEPADVSRIIQTTAVEKGAAGKDNRYGAGRIDAYAAYLEAIGTGGSIPCSDIVFFNARCNGSGTAQAMVKLLGDYGGEIVTLDYDGVPQEVTLMSDGSRSIGRLAIQNAGIGMHTIEMVDPAGCFDPIDFECTVTARADAEWDAIWQEYEKMEQSTFVPSETKLTGNYPNPFNPSTTISYNIGDAAHVTMKIYNTLGQEVATLVNQLVNEGRHTVSWNGTNSYGAGVASGLYIVRLTAGSHVSTQRILLMK